MRVRTDERQAILDIYRIERLQAAVDREGKLSERARSRSGPCSPQPPRKACRLPITCRRRLPISARPRASTSSDLAQLVKLDLGLTAMAVKYAGDASGGQFDPQRLSRYNDITPERDKAARPH